MMEHTKRIRAPQLMAALVIAGACSGGDATKNASANGRAVFESASEAEATDTATAEEVVTADEGEEGVDFDTFVLDGAGAPDAAPGSVAEARRWPTSAIVSGNAGSVTGQVFDAETGQPIASGTVSTAAACTGRSCGAGTRSRTNLPITRVRLRNGAFEFSSSSRQLTLSPTTTFRIGAPGYVAVRFAHGPWDGQLAAGNQVVTKLPAIYLCRTRSANSDPDGICDAAEARYGTDATKEDSDGDSLSDAAELYGVWKNEVLDIRGLGVDPRQTDVLLEIDAMPGRAPTQDGIDAMVAAFAKAPARPGYPDNKPGIALHAFLDDLAVTKVDWVDWPNYDNTRPIIRDFFNLASSWPTHYGLFAIGMWDTMLNKQDWATGISPEIPGRVFYMTVLDRTGREPTDGEKVRTLMHELGHNLGLQHGGNEPTNYKPNYFSIMNYMYQFEALPTAAGAGDETLYAMDYSRFSMPDLVESELNEVAGMNPAYIAGDADSAKVINPIFCTKTDDNPEPWLRECLCGDRLAGDVPGSLDFDGNGTISTKPVSYDLNAYMGPHDTIPGTPPDWEILDFSGIRNSSIPQRLVETQDPCPPMPTRLRIAGGATADDPADEVACPPRRGSDANGRFVADGGTEDASMAEDAAMPDGADAALTDAGPSDVSEPDTTPPPVGEGDPVEPADGDNGAPPSEDPIDGDEPPTPEDAGVWEDFAPFGVW